MEMEAEKEKIVSSLITNPNQLNDLIHYMKLNRIYHLEDGPFEIHINKASWEENPKYNPNLKKS